MIKKNLLPFIVAILLPISSYSKSHSEKEEQLFRLIKEWGIIENYHPNLCLKIGNSDSVFISVANEILAGNICKSPRKPDSLKLGFNPLHLNCYYEKDKIYREPDFSCIERV
jgi:hypothetical protein